MSIDLVQGTEAWLVARAGSLGASQIADIMAKTRNGWGASRANIAAALVLERLTGRPRRSYTTPAMQRGVDLEPAARDLYAFMTDADVQQVGLVPHPTIAGSHASPDGLVNDCGLVEIKCLGDDAHFDVLQTGKVPRAYLLQATWQIACTGRKWCDVAFYHPDMPTVEMQLHIQRVMRDDDMIAELEAAARVFLAEVDATVAELRAKFNLAA